MPLDIIVGTQWRDEGKGRMVDLLSSNADIVARYNGGDNTGHTVTVKDKTFKLHLLPSGIIHPHTLCVLDNEMVINPASLNKEIQLLQENGIDVSSQRLFISHAAHLITPVHIALDAAKEQARKGNKLGTTLRSIGPAYISKAMRDGIRIEALLNFQNLKILLKQQIQEANQQLEKIFSTEPLNEDETIEQFIVNAAPLVAYIRDTSQLVHNALIDGKIVLAEGAQGVQLDIEHGTYPYVTSCTTSALGALSGLGVGAKWVRRVIGITKVFQTRVGEGPFPTEVLDGAAISLRGSGANPWDEYGTTTGRPRRVGWLDLPLLCYATRVSGITEIFLTKLDVLSDIAHIPLCNRYRYQGKSYSEPPFGTSLNDDILAENIEYSDWKQNIQTLHTWESLPKEAKSYIHGIENHLQIPITGVSVGAEREQIILDSAANAG